MTGCRMFPEELPPAVRNNPKRRAECAVYDDLRTGLADKKFCVFYSKDWLNQYAKDVGQEDGECDFIVAHPELGLLFVEVKGGKVRRDGKSGQWYSGKHKIKNPVLQARNSKHMTRESLRELWGEDMPFIKMVHCVLLPDSACSTTYLGEGLPLGIFGFMDDMPRLTRKIYEFFDFEAANDGRINGKLGERGINLLKRMYAKDLDFSPKLMHRLARHAYLIEERTLTQQHIVKSARNIDKVLVDGPAGSGKTMLAIDLALMEAAKITESKGKALMVCYNAPLAGFLRTFVKSDQTNLSVHTYHSLCRELAIQSGILGQQDIDKNPSAFFEKATDYGWEAAERLGPIFNVIIVDEGQDFRHEWWELLQYLLKEAPQPRVRVFRDNNQRIYSNGDECYRDLQGPLLLDTVVRNTEKIGKSAMAFYSGEEVVVDGPQGDPIQWIVTGDDLKPVQRLVRRFVTYEGVKPSDIAVLTMQAVDKTVFKGLKELADYPVYKCDTYGSGIILDSVFRFKGLEREVVILCGFGEEYPGDELLYVGISRARSYIGVVASSTQIRTLKEVIEPLLAQ